MALNRHEGLLEQIKDAVIPLTVQGDFQLKNIEFDHTNSEVTIILGSPSLYIRFVTVIRIHTRVECYLQLPNSTQLFDTRYLFPWKKIDVPINEGHFITPEWGSSKTFPDYETELNYLINASGCIQELHRQCTDLWRKISEIRKIFENQNMPEFIHEYRDEVQKMKKLRSKKR